MWVAATVSDRIGFNSKEIKVHIMIKGSNSVRERIFYVIYPTLIQPIL